MGYQGLPGLPGAQGPSRAQALGPSREPGTPSRDPGTEPGPSRDPGTESGPQPCPWGPRRVSPTARLAK